MAFKMQRIILEADLNLEKNKKLPSHRENACSM